MTTKQTNAKTSSILFALVFASGFFQSPASLAIEAPVVTPDGKWSLATPQGWGPGKDRVDVGDFPTVSHVPTEQKLQGEGVVVVSSVGDDAQGAKLTEFFMRGRARLFCDKEATLSLSEEQAGASTLPAVSCPSVSTGQTAAVFWSERKDGAFVSRMAVAFAPTPVAAMFLARRSAETFIEQGSVSRTDQAQRPAPDDDSIAGVFRSSSRSVSLETPPSWSASEENPDANDKGAWTFDLETGSPQSVAIVTVALNAPVVLMALRSMETTVAGFCDQSLGILAGDLDIRGMTLGKTSGARLVSCKGTGAETDMSFIVWTEESEGYTVVRQIVAGLPAAATGADKENGAERARTLAIKTALTAMTFGKVEVNSEEMEKWRR